MKLKIFLVLIISILAFSACGGDNDSTPATSDNLTMLCINAIDAAVETAESKAPRATVSYSIGLTNSSIELWGSQSYDDVTFEYTSDYSIIFTGFSYADTESGNTVNLSGTATYAGTMNLSSGVIALNYTGDMSILYNGSDQHTLLWDIDLTANASTATFSGSVTFDGTSGSFNYSGPVQ